jgi:DNA-binding SARP family transcriptional activator/Flp pilus assembly protein TadD
MDFCLLGPLVVRCGGVVLPIPQGKQRAVLAALLLQAGHVVSVDELAEVLWGSAPPPSARVSVQNHVTRLRKALGDTGASRIGTRPHGYLIDVHPGESDVSRFEAHLDTARSAARDRAWDAAATEARAGLSLWRGGPLADVKSELLATRDVPRLAEQRLEALETRIDADLHLGRHAEVITELQQLTRTHPLREHLHGRLMLALHRDGRQAEALAAYQHARRILVEELGAEPGAELRELHQQMLTASPALAAKPPAPLTPGGSAAITPRELPAPAAHFVGRADELATLARLLDRSGDQGPGMIVVSAIGGTAGVGKTALAVHWAHQVAARFPDGQLYVNLRGYDPGQPVTAGEALAGFLRSLGLAGRDIPAEEAERAARYRSLLAGRRMLVVLDNAGSVEQVRPLLPGGPACAVVVTSRDSLAGLVAREGVYRVDLDLLPLRDAVGLLRALIGTRVDADPASAEALADRCCRLPLALRVGAELAASRPAVPLAELASELTGQHQRLDLLEAGGDARTAVRAVFWWSYRQLDAGTARMFRLLGLHPAADFEPYAAAALADATVERTRQLLDKLARAHLIQPAGPGRYGLHDLLRAYARELAEANDGEDEQRRALTRLFDQYLYTASIAMDTLYAGEPHRRPRVGPAATPVPPLADPSAARGWLDAERGPLVAVMAHMAEHGWSGHATNLAVTVFRYLDGGGHNHEALIIHGHAHAAARRAADRAAEAVAATNLGCAHWRLGRYPQAASHLQEALALQLAAGDRDGQARTLGNLGILYAEQGRSEDAAQVQQQALAMHREAGSLVGQVRALGNLGTLEQRLGHYEGAARYLEESLNLARKMGDRRGESYALMNIGKTYLLQGRHRQASEPLRRALALFREVGDRNGEAEALTRIGRVCLGQGDHRAAMEHHRRALALFREIGDRNGEAEALNELGAACSAVGDVAQARAHYAAALGVAARIDNMYQQACACDGLGDACHAMGDTSEARHYWEEALVLFTKHGTPEVGQVSAKLSR